MRRPLIAITCQRYPAGKLYKLEPAFAALAGAVVLSERLGAPELLAIGFVLVANAGAVLTRRARTPDVDVGIVQP